MTLTDDRRGVAVLGSTGSVGRQTLEVLAELRDQFRVVALAAGSNVELLARQAAAFSPSLVSSSSPPTTADADLHRHIAANSEVIYGAAGLLAAATHPEAELIVVATSGDAAINPTFAAISAGKEIVLANKETIVCAGELLMPHAAAHGVTIRPADSEHSAIWQCLAGAPPVAVARLHITASGGPFRTAGAADLAGVTIANALAHPTWSMGNKITIDSATLMNKGLEVIEAHWLFGVPYDRIDVVVHPESIVHSLVEFVDGSQVAQCGVPSMKLPLQYALTWPERMPSRVPRLSLAEIGALHFEPPDFARFPCLQLAYDAGRAGSTYPTVLSAADDVAVDAFLHEKIGFLDIPAIIAECLERHAPAGPLTREAITSVAAWATREAATLVRARRR